MTILGITGHRPQKLYGFDESHPGNSYIIKSLHDKLVEIAPSHAITGMALGTDQWFARWCIKLEIPFTAAMPTEQMDIKWPETSRKMFEKILAKASKVFIVEDQSKNISTKMQDRNEYIVDNSNRMLAVFGGQLGGTYNCLEYAKNKGKHIDIINPGNYFQSP